MLNWQTPKSAKGLKIFGWNVEPSGISSAVQRGGGPFHSRIVKVSFYLGLVSGLGPKNRALKIKLYIKIKFLNKFLIFWRYPLLFEFREVCGKACYTIWFFISQNASVLFP